MDQKVEIKPIAIPLNRYNQHIAELVEHLLNLDDKLNNHPSSEA